MYLFETQSFSQAEKNGCLIWVSGMYMVRNVFSDKKKHVLNREPCWLKPCMLSGDHLYKSSHYSFSTCQIRFKKSKENKNKNVLIQLLICCCPGGRFLGKIQKYSRLRCLLRVKGLVICFYLGWSGSTLLITKHIIKVG